MKKKVWILALTAMLLAVLAVPALAAEDRMADLEGHWSKAAFERWNDYGIVQGDEGGMRPDDNLTVAEFASLLNRTMGYTEVADNYFLDVYDGWWYTDAILRLSAAGILEGSNGYCYPRSSISCERATVMLARALGVEPKMDVALTTTAKGDRVSYWAAGYVAAMEEAGILNGTGDVNLAPSDRITRAAMVSAMDQSIGEYIHRNGARLTGQVDGIVVIAAGSATLENATIHGSVVVAAGASGKGVTLRNTTVDGGIRLLGSDIALTLENSTVGGKILLEGEGTSVQVGGKSQVENITAECENAAITVGRDATVSVLTVDNASKITNNGTVNTVAINADKVVIDGKAPVKIEQTEGTQNPVNSKGETVVAQELVSVAKVQVYRVVLHDSSTENPVSDAEITAANTYTVEALRHSDRGYVDVTVTAEGLKRHKNAAGQEGYWIGFAAAAPEGAASVKVGFASDLTVAEAACEKSTPRTAFDAIREAPRAGCAFYTDLGQKFVDNWAVVAWYSTADGTGTPIQKTTYYVDYNVGLEPVY